MEPISRIDPEEGKLFFRGHNAAELAITRSFEDVTFLLIHGYLPNIQEAAAFENRLLRLRGMLEGELPVILRDLKPSTDDDSRISSYEVDRTYMVGLLPWASLLDSLSEKYKLDTLDSVLAFVSLCPAVLAAGWRYLKGMPIVPPDPTKSHSHNFIWMLKERELPIQDQRELDTCFILHMDDPNNPSLTKLERAIKSGCSLSESLVRALQNHRSPLHHGAGEAAMNAMIGIDNAKNVESYIRNALENGERVYGLGHRIYKTIDPRAVILRKILKRRTDNQAGYELQYRIEEAARIGAELIQRIKNNTVYPNIDLYNAAVYHTFEIPYYLNTELFAVARASGWAAHIAEWLNLV